MEGLDSTSSSYRSLTCPVTSCSVVDMMASVAWVISVMYQLLLSSLEVVIVDCGVHSFCGATELFFLELGNILLKILLGADFAECLLFIFEGSVGWGGGSVCVGVGGRRERDN